MHKHEYRREIDRRLNPANVPYARISEKIAALIFIYKENFGEKCVYDNSIKLLSKYKNEIYDIALTLEQDLDPIKEMVDHVYLCRANNLVNLYNDAPDAPQCFLEAIAIYFSYPDLVEKKGYSKSIMKQNLNILNEKHAFITKFIDYVVKHYYPENALMKITSSEFVKKLPLDVKDLILPTPREQLTDTFVIQQTTASAPLLTSQLPIHRTQASNTATIQSSKELEQKLNELGKRINQVIEEEQSLTKMNLLDDLLKQQESLQKELKALQQAESNLPNSSKQGSLKLTPNF